MASSLDVRGATPPSAREAPPFNGGQVVPPPARKVGPLCLPSPPPGGDGAPASFSIREVAAATGVTTHTLRYYERAGLLHRVPRASSGHRRYGPHEVRWVTFLRRLHETGMPIRRMLEYARLARRGESTAAERRELLVAHRDDVAARMKVLAENLALIEKKIQSYEALEQKWREASAAEARS